MKLAGNIWSLASKTKPLQSIIALRTDDFNHEPIIFGKTSQVVLKAVPKCGPSAKHDGLFHILLAKLVPPHGLEPRTY